MISSKKLSLNQSKNVRQFVVMQISSALSKNLTDCKFIFFRATFLAEQALLQIKCASLLTLLRTSTISVLLKKLRIMVVGQIPSFLNSFLSFCGTNFCSISELMSMMSFIECAQMQCFPKMHLCPQRKFILQSSLLRILYSLK